MMTCIYVMNQWQKQVHTDMETRLTNFISSTRAWCVTLVRGKGHAPRERRLAPETRWRAREKEAGGLQGLLQWLRRRCTRPPEAASHLDSIHRSLIEQTNCAVPISVYSTEDQRMRSKLDCRSFFRHINTNSRLRLPCGHYYRTVADIRRKEVLPMSTEAVKGSSSAVQRHDPILQYIVIRRDLSAQLGWPFGSVIAQVSVNSLSLSLSLYHMLATS